jgi:hypothetical protein
MGDSGSIGWTDTSYGFDPRLRSDGLYTSDSDGSRRPGTQQKDAASSIGGNQQKDGYEISKEALEKLNQALGLKTPGADAEKGSQPAGTDETGKADEVSAKEKLRVDELKRVDQEVHAHELAHIMAGGALVHGGATYSYKTGPDGKRYAVSGEVNIDCSPVDGDPRATIRKALQIQSAARAPAQPSGQDQAVAQAAASMEMEAQRELSSESMDGSGADQKGAGTSGQKSGQRSGKSTAAYGLSENGVSASINRSA